MNLKRIMQKIVANPSLRIDDVLTTEERQQLAVLAADDSVKACVIADGNAFDGMTLYGPFPDPDTANEWAERHSKGGDWFNVNLNLIDQE